MDFLLNQPVKITDKLSRRKYRGKLRILSPDAVTIMLDTTERSSVSMMTFKLDTCKLEKQ